MSSNQYPHSTTSAQAQHPQQHNIRNNTTLHTGTAYAPAQNSHQRNIRTNTTTPLTIALNFLDSNFGCCSCVNVAVASVILIAIFHWFMKIFLHLIGKNNSIVLVAKFGCETSGERYTNAHHTHPGTTKNFIFFHR